MTYDQLRIFLAVAERAHVTRAAEALGLTQSAVSAAIAALEARHGLRLFDRIGRRIALTEAGRQFLAPARAALAQAELAEQALADLAEETRGRLRLHASQTVATYWLPPFLIALHEELPGIEIGLSIGNTAEVARAVEAGAADLGLVEGDVAQGGLTRRVVARDALVFLCARRHPLAAAPISADDYPGLDWILREPGSGTRAAVEAHLAALGLGAADLRIGLELPSNEAILAAVAAGRYVSILSDRVLQAHGIARDGVAGTTAGIVARPITWAPAPRREFSVLLHPERYRTRAVRALLARFGPADRG